MNRKELKAKAKEFAFKNKWNVWKILLVVGAVSFVAQFLLNLIPGQKVCNESSLFTSLETCTQTTFGELISIVNIGIGAILGIITVAYMLELVKTGVAPKVKDSILSVKKVFPMYFLVVLLQILNVTIGYFLLIVPGIIATFGLTYSAYVTYENPTLSAKEVLVKSWNLMKGYKWNYFVFSLSFIGWYLLIAITAGIATIWVLPLVSVANVMYYEKLKEIKEV